MRVVGIPSPHVVQGSAVLSIDVMEILSLLLGYIKKEVWKSVNGVLIIRNDINDHVLKTLLKMSTTNGLERTITSYVMLGEKMKQSENTPLTEMVFIINDHISFQSAAWLVSFRFSALRNP